MLWITYHCIILLPGLSFKVLSSHVWLEIALGRRLQGSLNFIQNYTALLNDIGQFVSYLQLWGVLTCS